MLPWAVAALVLYLATFVVTIGVHVPLNDGLKAAGDPDRIADLAAVRERFDEARWVRWNLARAVASTAAFGCLAWCGPRSVRARWLDPLLGDAEVTDLPVPRCDDPTKPSVLAAQPTG